MSAVKVGCGEWGFRELPIEEHFRIAAELGSMTVTEQVDALRMCNADPIEYLIVPRTIACAVMMVMLSIYGAAIAYFCGMICADLAFGVNYRTFLNLQLATSDDVIVGVTKAFSYGVAIPIIAGQAGLNAKGITRPTPIQIQGLKYEISLDPFYTEGQRVCQSIL